MPCGGPPTFFDARTSWRGSALCTTHNTTTHRPHAPRATKSVTQSHAQMQAYSSWVWCVIWAGIRPQCFTRINPLVRETAETRVGIQQKPEVGKRPQIWRSETAHQIGCNSKRRFPTSDHRSESGARSWVGKRPPIRCRKAAPRIRSYLVGRFPTPKSEAVFRPQFFAEFRPAFLSFRVPLD